MSYHTVFFTLLPLILGREFQKFIKRQPELIGQYQKTLQLLESNPSHPSLRLHKFSGKLSSLHFVSINVTYRISLEFLIRDDTIVPVNVGTHDEVYQP